MTARLEGLGVVLTRPQTAADALAAPLEREGARVILFPALAIEELKLTAPLEQLLADLARFDLAVFVSANAVEKALAMVRRIAPWPPRLQVAAIGEATAEALRSSGFAAVISPHERHDSEALLALPQLQRERIAGKNVIVFRGEGGREHLKESLEARGARVEYAECYRRVRPQSDPRPVLEALARGEVHAVSALSAETLENFVAMIDNDKALAAVTLVVPHDAIAAARGAKRFARVVVTGHGAAAFMDALASLRVTT
jgi:uroporphyrinogen-III synthase